MDNQNTLVEQLEGFIGLPREVIIKAMAFGGSLLKEPLSELSSIFVDDIRYLRVKNQVRILNKAKDYFEKHGISPKKIPAKTLVPLLEGCSLEENETLQEMWEALLINSIDPHNTNEFITGYIDILKQLSPSEVKLLDYIYTNYHQKDFYLSILSKDKDEAECFNLALFIDNFVRLNLIKNILPELLQRELEEEERAEKMIYNYEKINTWNSPVDRYWGMSYDVFMMTSLGKNFVEYCKLKKE